MAHRGYRQPMHARKGHGDMQPTPLSRIKAGQKNDQPMGKGDQETTAKNPADRQAHGSVHKIGTAYHLPG